MLDNGLIDYISMDVKGPLDEIRYSRCAGVSVNLDHIRESISLLKEGIIPYEFRVTAVPHLLDEKDIMEWAEQLAGAQKLTLQNYDPSDPLDPELKQVKPYTEERLQMLQAEVSHIFEGSHIH